MSLLYLASKSPRRRELLKQIGVSYELLMLREHSERNDIDETPLPGERPAEYVPRIVLLKAAAANRVMRTRRLLVRPILTADTTVVIDDRILGKPVDRKEAIAMLQQLSGLTHQVMTIIGLTIDGQTQLATSISDVTFKSLSPAEIQRYVESGESMDKAGGYGVQGRAAAFISHLSGSYSGVMGLPLYETAELLSKARLL